MATIYRKTAKGVAEIETRAHRLPPRMRSALIVVDGKRSDAALRPLILQQPDETLQALADQGFIEVISISDDRPTISPTPPAAAPAPVRAPMVDFTTRQREVVRRLTDLVGPIGDALAMRIERTRTPDELRPLLETARQVVANARGPEAAAEFAARFSDL